MQLWVLIALVATAIHGFSSVYSKRLYDLAPHPAQVAFFCVFAGGIASLALIPFIEFNDPSGHWLNIVLVGAPFALGHYCFVLANRYGDASFVVPMMSLKMFFVALFAAIWLDEVYSVWVYVGASGAAVGVYFLSSGKGHGSPAALLLVLGNCVLYAATDIFIVRLFRDGFSAYEVMIFLFTGGALFMLPLALIVLRNRWQVNRRFVGGLALFGVSQAISGVLLMTAFGLAGKATMVNIVQSSRGLFAVAAVYLISRVGIKGLEVLNSGQYLWRGIGSALIAGSIAVALFASQAG